MGRPRKEGVDYWNIDVDFFQDKKIRLIRSEFGIKGIYITILLLNEIYRTGGYYKQWDNDDCLLMSDSSGVAGDCSPQLIADVVQGLLRRSFFDKGIFERFHVLTSAGIQRRFLLMAKNRDRISMIQEYFLLDTSNREDVAEATLKKLAFYSISGKETPVSFEEIPVSQQGNPLKEKKEEESRGKERKAEAESGATAASAADSACDYFRNFINPTAPQRDFEEMAEFIRFFDERGNEGNAVVVFACQIAQSKRAFVWAFIRKVLDGWKKAGVYTLAQCKAYERDWKAKQGGDSTISGGEAYGRVGRDSQTHAGEVPGKGGKWGIKATSLD